MVEGSTIPRSDASVHAVRACDATPTQMPVDFDETAHISAKPCGMF